MAVPTTVRLTRQGRVGTFTLDRPPLNILDLATLEALDAALAKCSEDEDLQVVVLRGAGERAFSAGVAVEDHVAERIAPMLTTFHRALRRLYELPQITVAAVDGHCLGGGLEVVSVCDLVVATHTSRFGVPEIKLGCYPPVAAALFPRQLGWQRAMELLLTGRTLEAAEAASLGLVNRLADAAGLEETVQTLVAEVTAASGAVTRLLKRAARAGAAAPFGPALGAAEHLYLTELTATEDMHEGIAAFGERRTPVWKHR